MIGPKIRNPNIEIRNKFELTNGRNHRNETQHDRFSFDYLLLARQKVEPSLFPSTDSCTGGLESYFDLVNSSLEPFGSFRVIRSAENSI